METSKRTHHLIERLRYYRYDKNYKTLLKLWGYIQKETGKAITWLEFSATVWQVFREYHLGDPNHYRFYPYRFKWLKASIIARTNEKKEQYDG